MIFFHARRANFRPRTPRKNRGPAPLAAAALPWLAATLLWPAPAALAQDSSSMVPIPTVSLSMDQTSEPERIATVINILFLMTVLTLAPSLLILMTSFVRIVV
ncbi:MAG: hypothetical protein LBV70_05050, partial [Candidatus Adiutrix sp.]|nr:hypothetical protein [Candidatus Adiutrix sp.]